MYFSIVLSCFLSAASYALSESSEHVSLSLDEAILLAVSENPNVQSTRLNYVSQKFSLFIQRWQFYPHYSFQTSATVTRAGTPSHAINGSHNYNAQPAVSLLTPVGTQLSLAASNSKTGNYNPGLSLQIMQPLMRGSRLQTSEKNNADRTANVV